MAIILPANTLAAGGYSIDNSCRFNDDDTPKLTRDFGSDGSLVACTINVWVKIGSPITGTKNILWTYISGTNANLKFGGESGLGELHFYSNRTGESPAEPELLTDTFHRDPCAWYNIHAVWDSANGTEGDRMRLYLNGTRLTDFHTTSAYPQSNGDFGLFNYTDGARTLNISNKPYGGANHFDGYMANLIVCDGQTYEPTKFGEFDDDSPTIWKPIDPAEQSLNFGTHGFWLDFKDSSALGNDVSGNNNDYTVTNLDATDQATDTPTNNFAVLNPATIDGGAAITYSQGNCRALETGNQWTSAHSTLATGGGQWYFESKTTYTASTEGYIGATTTDLIAAKSSADFYLGVTDESVGYYTSNGNYYAGSGAVSYGSAASSGDIIGVALDLVNNKIYFSINGTWQNSSNPEDGTNAISLPSGMTASGKLICLSVSPNQSYWDCNFGGCSAFTVSSANQDGNGYGNFEYAVPSGYLALCTKNLGSDGG